MRAIPETVDVLVTHPYVYGVLQDLCDTYGLRGPIEDFDQEVVSRDLLRPDAPALREWAPDREWRWEATTVAKPEIYVHDWCDPEAFDRWLYRHYEVWHHAMVTKLELWMAVARDRAIHRGVLFVFSEGWIGYTPRDARFEEGPIGAQFCRVAVDESTRAGAWGTIVCSNAAPQHAMWADIALQQQCNAAFLAGDIKR